MALSNDLISQFVKITKDDTAKQTETTVYGTVKISDGKAYVQIDGSTMYTPISSTTDAKDGDRVTVMIKDHSAVVTGNMTAPSARKESLDAVEKDLGDKIANVDIVLADKVSTEQLNAVKADITDLTTKNLEVREKLTAAEADIDNLEADNVTIKGQITAHDGKFDSIDSTFVTVSGQINAANAKIEKLEATDAEFRTLEADYAEFKDATVKDLDAANANIEKLTADVASVTELSAKHATIDQLNATNAKVDNLTADVADIDTLIFGTASGDVIQTSFANAVIAQLGNAQIKSAMIENISASKITAGDISTNKVRVVSDDGKLVISDETIQISDDSRVRVQIGKDASGDYSISIWDASGNLMFSEGGITDNAIKNAIIRDDMVSDTANISAHKLDINSLFEEINGSSKTIKSSKIYLDDKSQTLDVAFTSLTTDVEGIDGKVTSQGTQITAIQGQISSKIWQQDIDTAAGTLSTKYSELEQDLDGFKSTVSETYTTKADFENLNIGGRNLFGFNKGIDLSELGNAAYTKMEWYREKKGFYITILADAPQNMIVGRVAQMGFNGIAGESYTFSGNVRASVDNVKIALDICDQGNKRYTIGTTSQKITFSAIPKDYYDNRTYNGFFNVAVGDGTTMAAGTILYFENVKIERGNRPTDWTPAPEDMATDADLDALDTRVKTVSTKVSQNEESISSVAQRTTVVENKFAGYSTTEQMNSAIEQKADTITTQVSATYATKEAVNNIEIGGRNLLLNTEIPLTVATTEEFTSRESTKMYPLHPDIVADPKAFLLSIKDSYLSFSYDVEIDEIYADSSKTLNGVGGYFTFNIIENETEAKSAWYGTHSSATSAGNNTLDSANSLISVGSETRSFNGHYAGYCDMSNAGPVMNKFYADPDKYTVTATNAYIEIRGFTKGGTIKNVQLEIGNKPTRWSPAPEDIQTDLEANITEVNQTIVDQTTQVMESCESIILSALESYVKTSNYDDFKQTVESQLKIMADEISMNFTTTTERVNTIDGELQTEINERSKHITFSGDNAINIGGSSGIILTVDNDNGIIFSKIASAYSVDSTGTVEDGTSVAYALSTDQNTPPSNWSMTMPSDIPVNQYLWIRRLVFYSDGPTAQTYSVAFGSWDGNDFYTGNIVIRTNERAQFGNFAFVPRPDGSLSFLKVGG